MHFQRHFPDLPIRIFLTISHLAYILNETTDQFLRLQWLRFFVQPGLVYLPVLDIKCLSQILNNFLPVLVLLEISEPGLLFPRRVFADEVGGDQLLRWFIF